MNSPKPAPYCPARRSLLAMRLTPPREKKGSNALNSRGVFMLGLSTHGG